MGPFDWTENPQAAWDEAINAPMSDAELRVNAYMLDFYRNHLNIRVRNCDHPRQKFNGNGWVCGECGKRMRS